MSEFKTRPFWVRLEKAANMERGYCWLATAFDIDWVTDGRNRMEALERLIEGIQALELDDRAQGHEFSKREPAALAEWPECVRNDDPRQMRVEPATERTLRAANTANLPQVLLLAVPIPTARIVNAKAAMKRLLDRSYFVRSA